MFIKFSCRLCGEELGDDSKNEGEWIRCPNCSGLTQCPAVDSLINELNEDIRELVDRTAKKISNPNEDPDKNPLIPGSSAPYNGFGEDDGC